MKNRPKMFHNSIGDRDDPSRKNQNQLPNNKNTEDTFLNNEEADNTGKRKSKNYKIEDKGMNARICKHYIKGTCKHGIKGKECRFDHPKACRKFMNHGTRANLGCREGKKCSSFHPKICFDSLRIGECFDNSCNFAHVKGTRCKREPQLGLPKHHIQGQKVPRYERNNYENKEMDFLAILEKFKKDILTEMEQRINKMTKPNQLPPTTQHIQQYQFPAQQEVQLKNKPGWTPRWTQPQNTFWGVKPNQNQQY